MNKRGQNRQPGAPALPGAGRPPQSATIKAGNPVMVAQTFPGGGFGHLGKGTAEITRAGSSRIVRVLIEDGSTLVITVF
jgi:hypothetical protein